jgi:hypothetical protein
MADMNDSSADVLSPYELQVQQQAIARQRAIADYLQKTSLDAPQGQMVSGHYVAPSGMQYIARLGQALLGNHMQSDLDQQQLGVARQYGANMLKIAQSLKGEDDAPSLPSQSQTTTTAPSNPAVTNSPVNLPTQDGDVQTFKQPLYPIAPDAPSQADAGMVSNTPARRPGGNPMFRGVGVPAISAYMQDPNSAIGKIVSMQVQNNLKGMEPTELIKTMRAAGIDENSPQGRQILQDNITKANYIAPVNAREGSTILDPRTLKPTFNAPNKEGFYYTFGPGGVPTAHQITGAADAIGAAEDAKAAAKANYQVVSGYDSNNQPAFTTAGAIARNANGARGNAGSVGVPGGGAQSAEPFKGANLLAQLPPNVRAGILESAKADPSGKFSLNYQLPNGQRIVGDIDLNSGSAPSATAPTGSNSSVVRPAAPPGYAAGQDVMATANAKGYQDLKTQAAGAADRINALDNILDLANGGTKYGPGTSERIEKLSSLNSYLPPGMAFGNNDIANAQVMQKWVSNLAGQYMKALGGTGSDAQLANSLKSISNPDMMNQAIREVVPKLKALEAAVQAKANAYDNWLAQPGNSVDKGNIFENQFRNAYDPRVFQLQMLSPNEQRAFISKLPPNDAAALLTKRQQLRAMGAF